MCECLPDPTHCIHNVNRRKLIQAGSLVNAADEEGNTPLLIAANVGNLAMVKLLLDAGSDAFWANHGGTTALVAAQSNGHDDVHGLLLGAQVGGFLKLIGKAKLPNIVVLVFKLTTRSTYPFIQL